MIRVAECVDIALLHGLIIDADAGRVARGLGEGGRRARAGARNRSRDRDRNRGRDGYDRDEAGPCGGVAQDVGALKQDVTALKQDVTVLKQDVFGLKKELATFRVEVRHDNELLRREMSESQAKLRGELL